MKTSKLVSAVLFFLLLIGCSGSDPTGASLSSGQAQGTKSYLVSHYAASRFAEQASMGPSPELVESIRNKGFEPWIDEQFALPPTQLPKVPDFYRVAGGGDKTYARDQFLNQAVLSQDQLRIKTVWSMSQFLVISQGKISGVASLHWMNMLFSNAFKDYGTLLTNVSTSPAMGWYLDNVQNRPKSAQCTWCEPNENFARELMELFSVGTTLINLDGSPKRDVRGAKINTYKQSDVEALARALTGWQWIKDDLYGDEWTDWSKPMGVSPNSFEHDWGSKTLLGQQIPAGQSAEEDLNSVIQILMSHENTAPFVATRFIQHFVKSNPSSAYVQRVSKVFKDNGKGQKGDLRAVIKAILLDPEARQGDDPAKLWANDGKYKEPVLFQVHTWRGLGCRKFPSNIQNTSNFGGHQAPFMPETVFSFYSPQGRASGSDLPAPEQKLINAQEFQTRMTMTWNLNWSPNSADDNDSALISLQNAGCEIDALNQLYNNSIDAYLDFLSIRYFRGTMPASLRRELKTMNDNINAYEGIPTRRAFHLMQYALVSPYFGIIK
jgi:uncharacterized protein (DUF1800 family)